MNTEYKNEKNNIISYRVMDAVFGGTSADLNRRVEILYVVYVAGVRVGVATATLHESANWAGNDARWTHDASALDADIRPSQSLLDAMLEDKPATMPLLSFDAVESWDYNKQHALEPVM